MTRNHAFLLGDLLPNYIQRGTDAKQQPMDEIVRITKGVPHRPNKRAPNKK